MRVFVPVEDAPACGSIPMLVPYQCGLACAHELRGFDQRGQDVRFRGDKMETEAAPGTERRPGIG